MMVRMVYTPMSELEISNEGEIIKIDVTDSTTASDVVSIVNGMWPGCAKLKSSSDNALHFTECFGSWYEEETKRIKRHNNKITEADRIGQKAEAAQRRAKGMHFK